MVSNSNQILDHWLNWIYTSSKLYLIIDEVQFCVIELQ